MIIPTDFSHERTKPCSKQASGTVLAHTQNDDMKALSKSHPDDEMLVCVSENCHNKCINVSGLEHQALMRP